MAITVAQVSTGVTGTGTAIATSFASPVTAGNGVIVLCAYAANSLTSFTDTAGNSYVLAETRNFFGVQYDVIYFCANCTGGFTTVTANFSASTSVTGLVALEVNGILTKDTSTGASSTSQNPQTGAINTAGAHRIVVSGINKSGSVITHPAGWTSAYIPANSGAAYRIFETVQTGLNPTWTTTASTSNSRTIAAFSSTNEGAAASPPSDEFGPEIGVGPPMPGAPWFKNFANPFLVPAVTTASNSPQASTAHVPEFRTGPPVPGAPWLTFAIVTEGQFPGRVRATISVPTAPGRGRARPFVERVPDLSTQHGQERLRRFTEKTSSILNALAGDGVLVQTGPAAWKLRGGAHVTGSDPTVNDDVEDGFFAGAFWVNSSSQQAFVCVSAATGAAVWLQIT